MVTDLERTERACRKVAEQIKMLAVGQSADYYKRIAASYEMLADELADEREKMRQEQDEDPEYTRAGVFGEDE